MAETEMVVDPRLPYLIGHRTHGDSSMSAQLISSFGVPFWTCEHRHTDYRDVLRCGDAERMRFCEDGLPMVPAPKRVTYVNASDDKYPNGRTGSAFVQRIEDEALEKGLD